MGAVILRAELLLKQGRNKEAVDLLEPHLAQYPEDIQAGCYLAGALLRIGSKKRSREVVENLLHQEPEHIMVLSLAADVELVDDHYEAAERRATVLLEKYPLEALGFVKMSRVKLGQRNYDKALEYAKNALAIDPEDLEALNLKIIIGGLLGDKEGTDESIAEALQLNPESASSIANQGLQLLREGKSKQALDRIKYALSLDPTNGLAKYAMSETLKAQFWPYRMFFKFREYTARLSGTNLWALTIGAYVVYRILAGIADNNETLRPFLLPIVYSIAGLFLLTWILNPLMNLYLLTNPYGKFLLDEPDKKMARLTGLAAASAILFLVLGLTLKSDVYISATIMCILLMIPLGSFLSPRQEKHQRQLTMYTAACALMGLSGALFSITTLFLVSLLGIFAYQFILNRIMIKENARVMED